MSILTATLKVLYQSIPTQQRIKVLTIKEMMIEPISIGLVGLLLLALLSFDMIYIIYYLILFVSIVWMIISKMLRNYYKLSLEKLLSQREIIADTFSLDTIDNKLLLKGIQSDNQIEVIYSLDSLIKVHYPDINTLLVELLNHPNTQVRLSVLGFIDQLDKEELLGDLKQHIKIESDDTVLHDLLRLYCKLGSMDAIETISPYIHHHHPEVQKGAILGLLQYGGIDGILVAGKVLDDLFSSDKRADQVISLNILKQIKTPSFYHPLSKLLESDDIEIRSLAITVIGNLKITQFIPNLLTNLTTDDYRSITGIALLKFDFKIFPQLRTFFHQTPSIESKYALIKVIAMLKEEESYHFLLDQLTEPQLSDMIYEKLFDSDFSTKNQDLIERLLHQEIEKILSFLHLLTVLDANLFPNSFLVVEEFIARKIENIFSIIGFYYNKKTILQAILNYQSPSKDKRAYAVEVIDNMVSTSMRKIVLPILDDTNSKKKLSSYATDMPETVQDPEKIIGIAISQEERPLILRLSLLYELGQHRYPIDINLIEDLTQDPNPEIRQTALWTLHQLKKAHHATDD
ncbi:MAG: hypothetical protein DRG30_10970 [Epsilonproteobacteria bacterium]|nr:MAG: hypothetical protein DRG30_10970 [Campylobacterota bacterium]